MTKVVEPVTIENVNALLDVPHEDSTTPVKEVEARAIYDFIKAHNIKRTLEIGFAYARSASHIMLATGEKHTAIDPFQKRYGSGGLANVKKLGLDDKLELIHDFSHHALPALVKEGKKYDFIFIDGDHKFDGIFVDFYYSDFLIDKGGYLLFHDTWMRSTQMALQFIRTNRKDYQEISIGHNNMTLFKKVSDEDNRDGMHFREFYTTKSFTRHHATMHMYENPDGAMRKAWLGLKKLMGK